jgi:MFS family permease
MSATVESTPPATSSAATNKWTVLAMLFVAAALNYGDRTAITTVFPLLKRDLGMSDLALGATGTAFLWSYAIASPLAGFLGDRVSRARLLTLSLGAWSLVMTLTPLVTATWQLLVMRVLLGIAEAGYIPAATALIADYHGPDTRAKAIGIHIAGFSLGMVGGGWLSGYLGDHYGWRPAFVILGVLGLALTAVCAAWMRDAAKPAAARQRSAGFGAILAELSRIPSFYLLTAELVLMSVVSWIFINWLPLFFGETFSLSLAMAGLYGTLWIQGGRVAGFLAGGAPSDLVAKRNPKYRVLIMAGCYLCAAPILLAFAYTSNFTAIAAVIVAFSLLIAMGYVNAQPLLCEILPDRVRATAIGLMNMGACATGGLGVIVAGALKSDVGLARSFASLSVIVALVSVMLFVGYRTIIPRDVAKSAGSR